MISYDERYAGATYEAALKLQFITAKVSQYLRDEMAVLREMVVFNVLQGFSISSKYERMKREINRKQTEIRYVPHG